MTPNLDSNLVEGTSGSPNSDGSQEQGVSSGSNDVAKLQKTLEAISKKLDEVDKRSAALQGDKDRAVTKTAKEVDDLKRKIAEIEQLKRSGYDADTAVDEFSFREMVREVNDKLSRFNEVPAPPAGNGQDWAEKAAKVVEQYGFTNNDVDANALIQQFGKDPEVLDGKLAKLYVQRQRTQSTPAQGAAPQGSTASAPSIEALRENYTKEMYAARGNPAEIRAIQAKFKKLGLAVEQVGFK